MGALIRSLESKIRNEPALTRSDLDSALGHIEQALVALVALHIDLRRNG